MVIKNEDFAVNITLGPSPNCSDLASEECKFIKTTITAKTAKGQEKLAKLKLGIGKKFWLVSKSKKTLSIKHYADE